METENIMQRNTISTFIRHFNWKHGHRKTRKKKSCCRKARKKLQSITGDSDKTSKKIQKKKSGIFFGFF